MSYAPGGLGALQGRGWTCLDYSTQGNGGCYRSHAPVNQDARNCGALPDRFFGPTPTRLVFSGRRWGYSRRWPLREKFQTRTWVIAYTIRLARSPPEAAAPVFILRQQAKPPIWAALPINRSRPSFSATASPDRSRGVRWASCRRGREHKFSDRRGRDPRRAADRLRRSVGRAGALASGKILRPSRCLQFLQGGDALNGGNTPSFRAREQRPAAAVTNMSTHQQE